MKQNIEVEYLNSGWKDLSFSAKINARICHRQRQGWTYHDIKISSSGNDTLLVFKKDEEAK